MNPELNLDQESKQLIINLLKKVDYVESLGIKVQSQPLGFMRLALDDQKNNENGHFLHVWLPGLPLQKDGPFIHTHVFDMSSKVLLGSIRDITHAPQTNSNGSHTLVHAACKEEYCLPLQSVEEKVDLKITTELDVHTGQMYGVTKGTFHTTQVLGNGIAITIIKKFNVEDKDPILLVPVGVPSPQDVFRRDQINQAFAYTKIRELLNAAMEINND